MTTYELRNNTADSFPCRLGLRRKEADGAATPTANLPAKLEIRPPGILPLPTTCHERRASTASSRAPKGLKWPHEKVWPASVNGIAHSLAYPALPSRL